MRDGGANGPVRSAPRPANALIIFNRDADTMPPPLPQCLRLRSGLNGIALIVDRPCHAFASFAAKTPCQQLRSFYPTRHPGPDFLYFLSHTPRGSLNC